MTRFVRGMLFVVFVMGVPNAFAGDKKAEMKPGKCTFASVERVKTHASQHIKYPAKGKDIKAVCKKEWPDEFSKEEWACIDASVKDDKDYKSAAEVLKALGTE